MSRESFEKIQHIKDHLEHSDIYYTNLDLYTKDNTPCFYLNGADMMDQGASVAYEHAYWLLKEVL